MRTSWLGWVSGALGGPQQRGQFLPVFVLWSLQNVYQGALLIKAIVIAERAMMHERTIIPPTMMAAIITAFARGPLASLMKNLLISSNLSFAHTVLRCEAWI